MDDDEPRCRDCAEPIPYDPDKDRCDSCARTMIAAKTAIPVKRTTCDACRGTGVRHPALSAGVPTLIPDECRACGGLGYFTSVP